MVNLPMETDGNTCGVDFCGENEWISIAEAIPESMNKALDRNDTIYNA